MSNQARPSRMMQDRRWIAGSFLVVFICFYLLYEFASCKMPVSFPRMSLGSVKEIAAKYKIDISAAAPMLQAAWLIAFPSRALMLVVLFKLSSQLNTVNKLFYISGLISTLTSIIWFFSYSLENFERCLFWLTLMVISNWSMLFQGCHRMQICQSKDHCEVFEPLSTGHQRLFKWCVVETCGFSAVWTTAAWMFTLAQVLAYVPNHQRSEATLRGLVTVEQAGTIALVSYFLVMLAWMYMDFKGRAHETQHASCVYPSSALIMLGLFLSNYSWNQGITRNNGSCLVLSATSLVVCAFRRRFWNAFGSFQAPHRKYN